MTIFLSTLKSTYLFIRVTQPEINSYHADLEYSWTLWSDLSPCGVTCGEGGFTHRVRSCRTNGSDPGAAPERGEEGVDCPGNNTDVQTCNEYIVCREFNNCL